MTARLDHVKPSRKVFVHIGLPPDLAARISLAASRSDVLPEDIIVDVLRDAFMSVPKDEAA
jgi:hypothetical protein